MSDIDEVYFEKRRDGERVFDASLLRRPLSSLHTRAPLVFSVKDTTTQAMRAMQHEHRGCVVVTEDGTARSRLSGIFTERDVLLRIIDRGRNPANLTLGEIMTQDPECLHCDASVAWALNKMEVGGFRHLPVVDDGGRPTMGISVRDIVQYLVSAFPEEVLNLPPEFGGSYFATRDGA